MARVHFRGSRLPSTVASLLCLATIACAAADAHPGSRARAVSGGADAGLPMPALLAVHIPAEQLEAGPSFDFVEQASVEAVGAVSATQRLDFQISTDGVQVEPSEGESWRSTLELVGVGRGHAVATPAPAAQPTAHRNLLRFDRGPDLSEWYVNGPAGLEQGFVLTARPPGPADGAPDDRAADEALSMVLAVTGDLSPALSEGGEAVLLSDARRVRLRYSGLAAFDATGRPLDAWLEVEARQVRLRVRDRGAVYPVAIDPTLSTEVEVVASDDLATGDVFGASVAIDGLTMIVGAEAEETLARTAGAAYVMRFDAAADRWVQDAKLLPDDGGGGGSCELDADCPAFNTCVSGVCQWVCGFTGGPCPDTDYANDRFGRSVAIDGRRAVVGRVFADNHGPSSGTGYVFFDTGSGWVQEQGLSPRRDRNTIGRASSYYGTSSAIEGFFAVFGAPGHRHRDAATGAALRGSNAGAVYPWLATMNADGRATWTQELEMLPDADAGETRAAESDDFGTSVSMQGGTLVVGAPGDAHPPTPGLDAGSVYVYVRGGSSWALQAKLRADDVGPGMFFGQAVAIDGDTLAIGAPGVRAAYVFRRTGTTWTQEARLVPCDGDGGRGFGRSVALVGERLAVGAPGTTASGESAVYVYARADGMWADLQKGVPSTDMFFRFGEERGVAIDDGQNVLVGSGRADVGAATDAGAVMRFRPVQPLGSACARDADCAGMGCFGLGACVDGVCCSTDSCSECNSCDVPGLEGDCSADARRDGLACGDASDTECTDPDTCEAGACLPNDAASGAACGDQGVECLVDDACDGVGGCMDGGPSAAMTACGDDSDTACTAPDSCDGAGTCEANHAAVAAACGDTGIECLVDDGCDGAGLCADGGFEASGAACGDGSATECDGADTCDGAGACELNHAAAEAPCGDQGVECRADDACDGTGACEDRGTEPVGAACGDPSSSMCSESDSCDAAGDCSPNDEPAGTACGDVFGECDATNSCDGEGGCAPNPVPNGTSCSIGACFDGVCRGETFVHGSGACSASPGRRGGGAAAALGVLATLGLRRRRVRGAS